MNKIPYLKCLLFVFALTTGIFLLPGESDEITVSDLDITLLQEGPLQTLTSKDLRKDLSILIFTLDTTYAGKLAYPKEFQTLKADLLKLNIDFPEGISANDFRSELNKIFQRFPDGHLNVEAQSEIYEITPVRYMASESEKDDCKPSVEFLANADKNTLLFRAPTFLIDENTQEYLETFFDKIDSADKVIFDLRSNTGGFVGLPHRIAARLWGEPYREGNVIQYFPSPVKTSYSLNNNSAYKILSNFHFASDPQRLALERSHNRNVFTKILNFNEYAYGSFGKKLYTASDFGAHLEQDINVYEDEPSSFEEKGFKGRIVVLVDRYCASACESFLESLEAHPGVVVIGERTAGASQFGRIGILMLPKSQLTIPLATAYIEFKDRRVIERVGYPPHRLIGEGTDPMAEAIAIK